jgi:glucose-1-phosphate adenylyltransferase
VEVLAAQQTYESADWYQGTADAVRQNMSYIQREDCDDVLILSGDQLYRMDTRTLSGLIARRRRTRPSRPFR